MSWIFSSLKDKPASTIVAASKRAPAMEGPPMLAELCVTDVAAQAKAALSRSRIFDLRRLQVGQDGEAVVLRGRVSSFYHKQLAQEVVRNATGGADVINALRVVYQSDRRDASLERAG